VFASLIALLYRCKSIQSNLILNAHESSVVSYGITSLVGLALHRCKWLSKNRLRKRSPIRLCIEIPSALFSGLPSSALFGFEGVA
jgi:hypothetical protein